MYRMLIILRFKLSIKIHNVCISIIIFASWFHEKYFALVLLKLCSYTSHFSHQRYIVSKNSAQLIRVKASIVASLEITKIKKTFTTFYLQKIYDRVKSITAFETTVI